jgi:hypothetical protein
MTKTIVATPEKTYHVEIRGQHSRGRGHGRFGGPDTYVAVQIVPAGVEPLTTLRDDMARRRGIEIVHFGEGYHDHQGPRSMLGRAIADAEEFALGQVVRA